MSLPFTFVVPLSWTGEPWNSPPKQWLGVNGKPTLNDPEDPFATVIEGQAAAVVFVFRIDATMAELVRIEKRLDDVNGGIGETVDLDQGIDNTYRMMRNRFEDELWPRKPRNADDKRTLYPEGRPKAITAEEMRTQEAAMDLMYFAPENDRDRGVLSRLHMLRDRQRVAAEWSILIVDPPSGWEDLTTKPLGPGIAEAIAAAYLKARAEASAAAGK